MVVDRAKSLGWHPSVPDQRDLLYSPREEKGRVKLPALVDLRLGGFMPPVYDQGELGACTAFAIASALEYEHMRQGLGDVHPSELFIYYEERRKEGSIASDAGAEIRDGMKVVKRTGAPPEDVWPYDISRFDEEPPPNAYTAALRDRVLRYQRVVQTLYHLKAALFEGLPVIFGFTVYESFLSQEVRETGLVPVPADTEASVGGHAVLAAGYNDDAQRFYCRNSWGKEWGADGYFTMPYAYLTDTGLAGDMWSIEVVV